MDCYRIDCGRRDFGQTPDSSMKPSQQVCLVRRFVGDVCSGRSGSLHAEQVIVGSTTYIIEGEPYQVSDETQARFDEFWKSLAEAKQGDPQGAETNYCLEGLRVKYQRRLATLWQHGCGSRISLDSKPTRAVETNSPVERLSIVFQSRFSSSYITRRALS